MIASVTLRSFIPGGVSPVCFLALAILANPVLFADDSRFFAATIARSDGTLTFRATVSSADLSALTTLKGSNYHVVSIVANNLTKTDVRLSKDDAITLVFGQDQQVPAQLDIRDSGDKEWNLYDLAERREMTYPSKLEKMEEEVIQVFVPVEVELPAEFPERIEFRIKSLTEAPIVLSVVK